MKIKFLVCLLIASTMTQAAEKSHMRGDRYCEIILAESLTSYAVYNTWGLNNCPQAIWNKITPTQVKRETHVSFVHLNGPRYWVIDGFKNSTLINPAVKTIDGLTLREAGVLHLSLRDVLKPNTPYQKREVTRQTTWVYEAGKPVYELIDSKGNIFVMQSYSVQKTPQTEQSLAQLGSKLKLPAGWQFKSGVLKKAQTVKAVNNLAMVVQDDLLNTYQKASGDLLN